MLNHLRFRRCDIVFAYPPESAESMIHVYMVWFPCGKVAFSSAANFHNGTDCKVMPAVIFNNSHAVALLDFHVTPPSPLGAKFVALNYLTVRPIRASNVHAQQQESGLSVLPCWNMGDYHNSRPLTFPKFCIYASDNLRNRHYCTHRKNTVRLPL